jgi:hypothetical protein
MTTRSSTTRSDDSDIVADRPLEDVVRLITLLERSPEHAAAWADTLRAAGVDRAVEELAELIGRLAEGRPEDAPTEPNPAPEPPASRESTPPPAAPLPVAPSPVAPLPAAPLSAAPKPATSSTANPRLPCLRTAVP